MKKILLAFTIVAFAAAVQAGQGKCCCGHAKAASMSQAKTACTSKAMASCSAKNMSGCCSAKASLSANKKCIKREARRRWLMSPKVAGELASAS
jgi:hypothetical protein